MKNSKYVSSAILGFVILLIVTTTAQAAGGFIPTGSLSTARSGHTATLLANGKVLVAGGSGGFDEDSGHYSTASAELFDPATGTWSPTGSLRTAREAHTATLLPNGKVLVEGGMENNIFFPLGSAELYDPATGTWSLTGNLGQARQIHTATLLPNGKVLFAGGYLGGQPLDSVELYDPAADTWSATGSLTPGRYYHTATLLPNVKVLVAGGEGGSYGGSMTSAELYDPATGTWMPAGSLHTARYRHTATLLADGRVLVAGGHSGLTPWDGGPLTSAEVYDPATGNWSVTGGLGTARDYHTATLLPNGKVLVVGGSTSNTVVLASAELYDPTTGAWTSAGSLAQPGDSNSATLLSNGQVLFVGAGAELYDSGIPFINPIINPTKLGDGSFQFLFRGNPSGRNYHILASPSLAAPLNTWSNLGSAIETPVDSGQFQFTDHQATNYPKRFYRVTSP